MNYFYYIFIFLNLFLTENILLLFRITNFSLINNMLIAISILFFGLSNIVLYRANRRYCLYFTLLLLIQIFFYIFTGADEFKSTMSIGSLFVIGAMPVSQIRTRKIWKTLFLLFLSFYVFECTLSIIERIFSANLPILRIGESLWEGVDTGEDNSFRSEALLGHPLQNALIVVTAMSFILISKISVNWKFGLWALGFLSLLCFNSRFAIVFSGLLMCVYLLNSYRKNFSKQEKYKVRLFSVLGVVVVAVLFFVVGLGDRLLNMGLMDESSATARFSLFDIFIGIDFSSLLFPMDARIFESLMAYRDIRVIENFWIIFLFNYGILFLSIIVIAYILILKNLYKNYSTFSMLFTVFAFFVTASTNNSLVTSWHMLVYYLFFVILFNPKMQLFILPASMRSDKLKLEMGILKSLIKKIPPKKAAQTID